MNPLMRFALPHAEQAALDDLERIRFQGGQKKQQPVFGCPQGTVLIDGKSVCGARFPIEAPRRHPCVERRLEGRDQLLKLVERQAGAIQELCGARLQIVEPYTSHESCLLSLSCDVRGASYQKESEINSLLSWVRDHAGRQISSAIIPDYFASRTLGKNQPSWQSTPCRDAG